MRLATEAKLDSAATFAPLAMAGYREVSPLDAHDRFDVGILAATVGDLRLARAQSDTILDRDPNHLLGMVLAIRLARRRDDAAFVRQMSGRLSANLRPELERGLKEYARHRADIDAAVTASPQPVGDSRTAASAADRAFIQSQLEIAQTLAQGNDFADANGYVGQALARVGARAPADALGTRDLRPRGALSTPPAVTRSLLPMRRKRERTWTRCSLGVAVTAPTPAPCRVLSKRKPLFRFRLSGEFLLRFAARALAAVLFHDPPRKTRYEPIRPLGQATEPRTATEAVARVRESRSSQARD